MSYFAQLTFVKKAGMNPFYMDYQIGQLISDRCIRVWIRRILGHRKHAPESFVANWLTLPTPSGPRPASQYDMEKVSTSSVAVKHTRALAL